LNAAQLHGKTRGGAEKNIGRLEGGAKEKEDALKKNGGRKRGCKRIKCRVTT